MSPIAHLQYGWLFAHWGKFSRGERAAIALAGAAPDLDGLTYLAGSEAFYQYHHILFHNVGSVLGVALLTAPLLRRRPKVWLLITFAFAMHMVEDFITSSWDMFPWKPVSAAAVNLTDTLPAWTVQGLFQTLGVVFILGMTIRFYLRYQHTPLEILSPALDRVVVNYAVLPWRNRCATSTCRRRAHFRCEQCSRTACSRHGGARAGLKVLCNECYEGQVAG